MTFATLHLLRPLMALVKKEYTPPSPIHIRVLSPVLTGRTATREVLHHSNGINTFINVNPDGLRPSVHFTNT